MERRPGSSLLHLLPGDLPLLGCSAVELVTHCLGTTAIRSDVDLELEPGHCEASVHISMGCAPSSASSIRQSSCLRTTSTFRVHAVLQGPAGTPRWGFVACQVCPGKGTYDSEVVLSYEHRLPGALTFSVCSFRSSLGFGPGHSSASHKLPSSRLSSFSTPGW